jgi:uncharacterized protein YqeY
MSIAQRIEQDYLHAYKARDQRRIDVLRLLKTAVKNRQVELRRPLEPLDDAAMLEVISRQAKQRQDSIDQFAAAGRRDLADKERAELLILREYLPEMLSEQDLDRIIAAAIAEVGATGARHMGAVMQLVMSRHKGQVDGRQLSAMVKARLG